MKITHKKLENWGACSRGRAAFMDMVGCCGSLNTKSKKDIYKICRHDLCNVSDISFVLACIDTLLGVDFYRKTKEGIKSNTSIAEWLYANFKKRGL